MATRILLKYFEILGVSENATLDEVKKAYRVRAKEWHPDISKEKDAHEKFIELQNAYEFILGYFRVFKEGRWQTTTTTTGHASSRAKYQDRGNTYSSAKQEEHDLYREWLMNEMRKAREKAAREAKKRNEHYQTHPDFKSERLFHRAGNIFSIGLGAIGMVGSVFWLKRNNENSILLMGFTFIVSLIIIVFAIADTGKETRE